jgi:hypothetical protein
MTEFKKTLRFRRLNTIIDITDINITGFWVKKNVPISNNENLILQYLNDYQVNLLPILKSNPKDIITEKEYFKINHKKLDKKTFLKIEKIILFFYLNLFFQ